MSIVSDITVDGIPFIMEGQVISTADPDQMGRCKVWVPSLDGENFEIDQLPWCEYASPFFGFTVDYPAGSRTHENDSHVAYGMWAIPKVGATVLVFCLNADPASRFYFAATARLHRNRSLPAGRNTDSFGNIGPFGDAGDGEGNLNPISPAYSNLREQFQNKIASSQAKTRGMYERQVAQASYEKDGTEGYSANPADPSYLDPQTYCIVTPGRHAIIMQDDPRFSRLRLKTAEGHQVIFDDANERIYVSTAKGKSWFELDQDGHVHVFGAASMSMRAGADFNIFADKNINLEAGGAINIKANGGDIRMSSAKSLHLGATGSIFQSACANININAESSVRMTALGDIDILGTAANVTGTSSADIKSGGGLTLKGAPMNMNGPEPRTAGSADCGEPASSPSVVPGHEPWPRPASSNKRGPNWKE